MGIALWLVPKSHSLFYESADSLIISLHTLFDNAPTFEPHITITSGIVINTPSDVAVLLNSALAAINSLNQIHQQRREEQQQQRKQMENQSDTSLNDNNTNISESSSENAISDQLILFDKLEFGKKYFQKVKLSVYPNPNLVSFARIIRELFVEAPGLKQRVLQQSSSLAPPSNDRPKRSKSLSKRVASNSSALSSATSESTEGGSSTTLSGEINPADISSLAMKAAERWSLEEFNPHLSLVYSNVYAIDSALERTIKTRVEDLLSVLIDGDNRLVDDAANLYWPDDGCLKLVRCEGEVKDWEVLGSIDYHLT
ncbi:2',3'-cyclic-nucleotide 3'-phosphodiesterase [Saccharomycopsis crataegensis]|uniref:2',3'-cyclic-nucleotide 3'-phosphodiesterase n=1 Tax=Saccharomycopsis crataegensis TaxID=43959 RepID=A0AAV5QEM4_9ASCO|nr:2',3'-cyclic-nucleotide 3'-phosphodiesterase [Saccharomycopsis crataegensis]